MFFAPSSSVPRRLGAKCQNDGLRKEHAMTHEVYESCIEACVNCAQACEHCATACLTETDIKSMAECIRLDRDCAEICWLAAGFMSRGSHFVEELCRVCAEICEACGAACRMHEHVHCQECADACERCAEECRRMAHTAV
jgi:hypothetical protein